jgi:hypothetical protein
MQQIESGFLLKNDLMSFTLKPASYVAFQAFG